MASEKILKLLLFKKSIDLISCDILGPLFFIGSEEEIWTGPSKLTTLKSASSNCFCNSSPKRNPNKDGEKKFENVGVMEVDEMKEQIAKLMY